MKILNTIRLISFPTRAKILARFDKTRSTTLFIFPTTQPWFGVLAPKLVVIAGQRLSYLLRSDLLLL
jgi:hypothetical protein